MNTLLRASTLGSRFALFFFLARFLEPSEIGTYGLFTATLLFCILLAGLEFYTFSQRELMSSPPGEHAGIIIRQAFFHLLTYLILLPLLGGVFLLDLLPLRFLAWFYILLPLEHLTQEVGRVLIALGRPLFSGVVLFVKMGLWTWIGIAGLLLFPGVRNLEFVLLLWMGGCAAALVLGVYGIMGRVQQWRMPNWDWTWAVKGIKVGMLFLVSTLSFRALTTFDKYLVKFFSGPDLLGAYVLYAALATSLMTFMDSSVFVFLYPKVVESFRKGRMAEFRRAAMKLARDTLLATIVLALGALLAIPFVIMLVGKEIYLEKIHLFWWLLAAVSVRSLGMVPHYVLYAFGRDFLILASQVTGVAVFGATAFLMRDQSEAAVPVSLLISFAYVLGFKGVTSIFFWKREQTDTR